ncbi:hypothetical protein B0H10DRAFT_813017 [Mycena sp. CBHHK59/15]|nr:hypothetical protein B0H10DRAFT_813017 [Mycena sp. CBHHK59/15]
MKLSGLAVCSLLLHLVALSEALPPTITSSAPSTSPISSSPSSSSLRVDAAPRPSSSDPHSLSSTPDSTETRTPPPPPFHGGHNPFHHPPAKPHPAALAALIFAALCLLASAFGLLRFLRSYWRTPRFDGAAAARDRRRLECEMRLAEQDGMMVGGGEGGGVLRWPPPPYFPRPPSYREEGGGMRKDGPPTTPEMTARPERRHSI